MRCLHIRCVAAGADDATLSINATGWREQPTEFEVSIDDPLPTTFYEIDLLAIAFTTHVEANALPRILLSTIRHLTSNGIVEIEVSSDQLAFDFAQIERVFGLLRKASSPQRVVLERAPDSSGEFSRGLVSILIAAWNPRFFEKALRSALAQTYAQVEVIVGDDRPDDHIETIVDRYRDQRFPIHYQRNEPRLMVRANYAACFDRSRGEFIKYLNDDDTLEPHCVERMVQALNWEPSAVLATSARSLVDDRGGPKQDIPATIPLIPSDAFVDGRSLANALLMLGLNFVGEPSTVLFRRNLAKLGDEPLFDFANEFGRGVTDFVLWSKLLCRGDAVYLRERLSSFRVHAEQRQALPEVQHYAVNSIPALRNRWLELGGHLSSPPSLLRIRSIQSDVFRMHPIALFGANESNKKALTEQWRNRTHPFFQAHQ
jgi:hypothetical protein